jgi:hypothetical protein
MRISPERKHGSICSVLVAERKQSRPPKCTSGRIPKTFVDHRLNIVAVGDEPSVAHSLSFVLSSPSREITMAYDGKEAVARIAGQGPPFDVVISPGRNRGLVAVARE